jgi:hypothetical protein
VDHGCLRVDNLSAPTPGVWVGVGREGKKRGSGGGRDWIY